jgi:hypothetical protein
MGWLKRIAGGLEVAGGIASEVAAPGNPAGIAAIASGGAQVASSFGGSKAPAAGSQAPAQAPAERQVDVGNAPPLGAARIRQRYGYGK